MFAIIAVALLLALLAARGVPLAWGERERLPASPAFVLLWVIGVVCAVGAAVMAKFHRLVAITLMGGAGLVTCLTFVWFSAPDLALTQIVVEVVTTMLFLLGLRWLPMRLRATIAHRVTVRDRARRGRDLAARGRRRQRARGALLRHADPARAAQHLAVLPRAARCRKAAAPTSSTSCSSTFARFDTHRRDHRARRGRAHGLRALASLSSAARRASSSPQQQRTCRADVVTDLVKPRDGGGRGARIHDGAGGHRAPAACRSRFVVAAHFFLRGHNEPGGGFVAGLVVAIAILMQYLVAGTRWVEARTRDLRPRAGSPSGCCSRRLTGLGAVAFGYPFLTTHTAHVTLPLVGDVHLPSATFFDLGVFAVVVGATLLILTALAHQSIRAHRAAGADSGAAEAQGAS